MFRSCRTMLLLITVVLSALATTARAQTDKDRKAPSVSGGWTLNVDGGPHGAVTMGLSLKQADEKITGSFSSPHGDVPVEGTFADGRLKLATPAGGEVQVTFSATLKADDTLSGYISSEMGDMTFMATRIKDAK